MRDRNLEYLCDEYLFGTSAGVAYRNFQRWDDDRLGVVLRHHNQTDKEGLSDEETWRRDEFDYLLGFYGIVEIAAMIGFVGKMPAEFRDAHLPILRHPAVRRYYEWNYPLELPRRLRKRLMEGMAGVEPHRRLSVKFFAFLELTRVIERDDDVESFLWTLDGGWREYPSGTECDIDIVRKALRKPERFIEALQIPQKERNEVQLALNGFYKFIQFCEEFEKLLCQLQAVPEVAEAMWLHHAYWFTQFEMQIGRNFLRTLEELGKWETEKMDELGGEEEGAPSFKERVREIEKVISALAVPPLAEWKAAAKNRTKSAERHVEDFYPKMAVIRSLSGVAGRTHGHLRA
jgi:hypothetical protein